MRAKNNKTEKRKWDLQDDYAIYLFNSSCH